MVELAVGEAVNAYLGLKGSCGCAKGGTCVHFVKHFALYLGRSLSCNSESLYIMSIHPTLSIPWDNSYWELSVKCKGLSSLYHVLSKCYISVRLRRLSTKHVL